MRASRIAIVAAALLLPASAYAAFPVIPMGNGPGGRVNFENPNGFKNKGQCQSALSREINAQRQDPDSRVPVHLDKSTSEFQLFMLDRFVCLQAEDGAWHVYVDD